MLKSPDSLLVRNAIRCMNRSVDGQSDLSSTLGNLSSHPPKSLLWLVILLVLSHQAKNLPEGFPKKKLGTVPYPRGLAIIGDSQPLCGLFLPSIISVPDLLPSGLDHFHVHQLT